MHFGYLLYCIFKVEYFFHSKFTFSLIKSWGIHNCCCCFFNLSLVKMNTNFSCFLGNFPDSGLSAEKLTFCFSYWNFSPYLHSTLILSSLFAFFTLRSPFWTISLQFSSTFTSKLSMSLIAKNVHATLENRCLPVCKV